MSEVKYPKLMWMNSRPEDTDGYTFALNAVKVNEQDRGFLATEQGNSLAFETGRLGIEYIPLGFIPLSGDTGVLLSVREDEVKSEIGLVHNSTYTTLINSNDLGFTLANQIQGTYTIVNGCERVVVFRSPELWAINIDNLDQYLLTGETQTTANADGAGWDISIMKLFLEFDRPTFASIKVDETSGDLPLGTYQIVTNYLDSSLNESGWMDMSLPIPIVDESFAALFSEIDGGFNSVIPPTNKSILVTFSNLDLSYSYLRIALIANNDGVRTAYKIIDYPLSSTEHTVDLRTISGEDITTIPLAEIAVSKMVYDEAVTVAQTENRLIIGGPKEKQIDHALFQQMANDIKVSWFNKELVASDTNEGTKSPEMYLDYRGYMSNEVYSLGVVVVFKDGYESPVYHIPGREQNVGYRGDLLPQYIEPNTWHNRPGPQGNWDSSLLIVDTQIPLADVEHLGFETATTDIGYGAGYVPRWMACNTAIRFNTPSRDYHYDGDLAYWESTLPYPDTLDCDGNRVFPEGNVRHHKMPDVTLVPHYLFNYLEGEEAFTYYPLGLQFTDVNIPAAYADEVAGYKIVREKRNSNNTSVFDKGLFTTCMHYVNPTSPGTFDIFMQPYPHNFLREADVLDRITIDEKYAFFHSPRVKFNRELVGATHLKLDQRMRTANFDTGESVAYYEGGPVEWRSYSRYQVADAEALFIPNVLNRKIALQAYLDADILLDNYFEHLVDNSEGQEAYMINLVSNMEPPSTYTTLTGLGATQYPELMGSNTTNPVYYYYGGLETYLPDQYGFVGSGAYIACSSGIRTGTESQEYGGDTFISRLYFRRHLRLGAATSGAQVPANHDEPTDGIESHLITYFVESTINCGLRNEGTEDTEVYYPKSYLGATEDFIDLERTVQGSIDTDLIPNYYAYNSDFSAESDTRLYFTLPENFDYCQDCYGDYKNRVAWTNVKNSENNMNPWRSFLSNNYIDLMQDKGAITNMFIDSYTLYVHTLGSLLQVPTQYQQISSEASDLYVGTGTFMGLGGKELVSLKEGFSGSDAQWATCTTQVGTFFVSYDKIFLLAQGSLVEVSKIGASNFFFDNQMQFYNEFYTATGLEYPFKDNPANPKGLGWLSVNDPKKTRWILSKKDYKLLFECQGIVGEDRSYTVGEVYWDDVNNVFKVVTTGGGVLAVEYAEISFSDAEYFQNCSFTLSFDLDERGWLSFHSYLPNFVFNTAFNWYSFKDSGVYKHNSGEYRDFYGVKSPFIVEQPISQNILQTSITNTIQYTTMASSYDDTYKTWKSLPDETFNKIWLYNDTQSSGILDIVTFDPLDPFALIDYTPGETLIYKAGNTWNVNTYFNYVTAQPFISKAWTDTQADYFIDKVPVNTDYTTLDTSVERFNDGYINCRFIYDKEDNTQLLFKYLRTYDIPTIR